MMSNHSTARLGTRVNFNCPSKFSARLISRNRSRRPLTTARRSQCIRDTSQQEMARPMYCQQHAHSDDRCAGVQASWMNSQTSSHSNTGCSSAAKCPPYGASSASIPSPNHSIFVESESNVTISCRLRNTKFAFSRTQLARVGNISLGN